MSVLSVLEPPAKRYDRTPFRMGPAVAWGTIVAPRFHRIPIEQLAAKSDEEVVAYAATAKRARVEEEARLAIHLMLFRHERRMQRRVELRLPQHLRHHGETVAGWVFERVMRSALGLKFEGGSVGEWVNWWSTAVDRQYISFGRSALGQSLTAQRELPSEHEGEDDAGPDRLSDAFDEDAHLSRVLYAEIVQAVLARMDNATHVAIIHRAIFEDRPSAEVAEEFDTTANNVDVIKRRFREHLRQECIDRGITES